MKQDLQTWLHKVADLLSKTTDMEDMKGLLEDMLTPQEIVELGERMAIIGHLLEGKTQRVVAQTMGISVTTVNRGARVIKFGTGSAKKLLENSAIAA